jgi:hypothetical protein
VSYAISLSGTTVSIASPGPRGVGVPTGGTTGQVLKKSSNTDYDFTWGADTEGIADIVEDTTPQLGGNLDVNGNAIVSASAGNIAITPDTTGRIVLDGFTWPDTDGTPNQVLKTNGSGTLSFGDASVVATSLDLTDTPGSYGTAGEVLALNSGATAFEFVANVASNSYTLDTLGTVAEGSITDVVALTATQYADIASPDPNTLFVITNGTTSIADSDDVTITAAATNDFLIYTGSVWEDQTPAQARTALGLGTLATASTITDSYVGHIETLADGTYYIDVRVPAGRTLTSFYIAADSGASATVDLQEGGVSMLSATASLTGGTPLEILTTGTTPTISDTALAADAVLTIVLSGSSSGDNFRFAVEYTQ